MPRNEEQVNKADEDIEDAMEREEDTESTEQLLARLYDTAYLLQKRNLVEIFVIEEDEDNAVVTSVISLPGVTYDKEDGFVQKNKK